MPELPEVETVCRGLRPVLDQAVIQDVVIRQCKLRIPIPTDFRKRLVSRRIINVRRRAKYILIELSDGGVIIGHLGMSGRMTIYRLGDVIPSPARHDHFDLVIKGGTTIRYSDPRRFGLITHTFKQLLSEHVLLRKLGPDPLCDEFNGEVLAARLKGRKTSIKSALLDQKILAGLGNIYICESLFRSHISPKRKAENVQGIRASKLVRAVKQVLSEAIDAGGSSLRDHMQPDGTLGYFQHNFQVYGREGKPCPNCNCNVDSTGGIKRIIQGDRSTFYCSRKQR